MTETLAETLRRAAALMRERAGGCEPRRWHWEALGGKGYPQRVTSDGNVALIAETFIDPGRRPYEAEHIASWSPPVALAVAGWLDSRAGDADSATPANGSWDLTWCDDPPGIKAALEVARAYLGEA